jgi:hypothetical protein
MGSKPPFFQIATPISTHCAMEAAVGHTNTTHHQRPTLNPDTHTLSRVVGRVASRVGQLVVIRGTEEKEEGEVFVVGLLDDPLLLDHSRVPQSRLMPQIRPFVGGVIRFCAQPAMNVIAFRTRHTHYRTRHDTHTTRTERGAGVEGQVLLQLRVVRAAAAGGGRGAEQVVGVVGVGTRGRHGRGHRAPARRRRRSRKR